MHTIESAGFILLLHFAALKSFAQSLYVDKCDEI